jgi:hypothetical protein
MIVEDKYNSVGAYGGNPNVVDYGNSIIYDEISYELINNLIVYFERHDRNLTDLCMSVNNLKKLEKAFIAHYGPQAEGTFKWSEDGFLLCSKNWGINFHSTDTYVWAPYRDEPLEIKHHPSGDDKIYAYDWTDTNDPWMIEVKLGEEKCEELL